MSNDKRADPIDTDDALRGQVCTASGFWYPAHRIVIVDNLPYGDEFAPDPQTYPTGNVWPGKN